MAGAHFVGHEEPASGEYHGDIYALEHDADELQKLGVEIGPFRAPLGCFENCRLSAPALHRLQVLGGKYLWDLRPVRVSGSAWESSACAGLPRYH
ncbi:hypothetical protein CJ010_15135 [Azoarcus sp. DD4]|uniref:hypothetical protein n=1 Tax=Azoarcus sp. DD4 TaxID=2027405 RepID=UPI001126E805|nr:hypothetical protein [Azoarcus sp. DD4]QDF97769.1 hypothetical protein CJ010_15135 [Azoarcus sp. DD4]